MNSLWKIDWNYISIKWAALKNIWKEHPAKQLLYGLVLHMSRNILNKSLSYRLRNMDASLLAKQWSLTNLASMQTLCCILTFDPSKLAISRKWHILMAVMRGNRVGGNWLTKWDKVKFPWYTHRLMHRKRVTCKLHDSYFRLMTIKHAIPKIE